MPRAQAYFAIKRRVKNTLQRIGISKGAPNVPSSASVLSERLGSGQGERIVMRRRRVRDRGCYRSWFFTAAMLSTIEQRNGAYW
nr:hypothetical protein CFP56_21762 [Quercus suber]